MTNTQRAPGLRRQESAKLFCEINQDRARLEYANRRRPAAVHQCGNFRVGIDGDKATAELMAIVNADQPSVVFRATMPSRKQLFQHHRDLHAIGRSLRIKLQRMLADREFFVMGCAGDGAIDVGEFPAVLFVPRPDFWWGVGCVGHLSDHNS